MQYRKIIGIIKDTDRGIDAVKVIFIFPAYVHADNDKSLLCKCLNFSLSKKNVELLEYLWPFELLFHEVNDLGKIVVIKKFWKVRWRNRVSNFIADFGKENELNSLKKISKVW